MTLSAPRRKISLCLLSCCCSETTSCLSPFTHLSSLLSLLGQSWAEEAGLQQWWVEGMPQFFNLFYLVIFLGKGTPAGCGERGQATVRAQVHSTCSSYLTCCCSFSALMLIWPFWSMLVWEATRRLLWRWGFSWLPCSWPFWGCRMNGAFGIAVPAARGSCMLSAFQQHNCIQLGCDLSGWKWAYSTPGPCRQQAMITGHIPWVSVRSWGTLLRSWEMRERPVMRDW